MYYTCVHARIHLDKSSSSSTASEGTSTAQDVCVGTTTSCHHGTAAIGSAARALSTRPARSINRRARLRVCTLSCTVYSCRHARACVSLEPTYPTNDICLHFQPMRRLFVYAFPRKLGLFRVRGEKQTHLEMLWNSIEMPRVRKFLDWNFHGPLRPGCDFRREVPT
eukprot:COSAG02_NODE_215_length_28614_cov_43.077047_18_plen_166_part_00